MNDQTVERRRANLQAALHSDALEGGDSADDAEFVSWMSEWAQGELSPDEIRARLAERYRTTEIQP